MNSKFYKHFERLILLRSDLYLMLKSTSSIISQKQTCRNYHFEPALPGNFDNFLHKSKFAQHIKIKQNKLHFRVYTEFTNKNLRQIGPKEYEL